MDALQEEPTGLLSGKGKEKDKTPDGFPLPPTPTISVPSSPGTPTPKSPFLVLLPTELIQSILSYLSPLDLASVSATCRTLHTHANTGYIWQALIQENVPGQKVTKPYPCPDFKTLYQAHDTRWFLPKYKIWFADKDLTGRLVIVRFDQRRGCIEGYQLVAISKQKEMRPWEADENIIIHAFEPDVHLHLDKPIIQLHAVDPEDGDYAHQTVSMLGKLGSMRYTQNEPAGRHMFRYANNITTWPPLWDTFDQPDLPVMPAAAAAQDILQMEQPSSSSSSSFSTSHPRQNFNRFGAEIPMRVSSDAASYCTYMPASPLSRVELQSRETASFPYGNIWPPPIIPASHRVKASGTRHYVNDDPLFRHGSRPTRRSEISERAFRTRKWFVQRVTFRRPGSVLRAPTTESQSDQPEGANNDDAAADDVVESSGAATAPPAPAPAPRTDPAASLQPYRSLLVALHEEVTTFATLDPKLYTPTKERPFRGIWVGDYSGHGCEFLLIMQPDDDPPPKISRRKDETDEQFERRKYEETVYRGELKAIKLTGDPNIPRGESTFFVHDLGPRGYIRTIEEAPFKGARVVKSMGHIAHTGFRFDRFIECQLFIISHDRLAQYWVEWGHVSFFERVDIDKFLVPR